MDAKLAVLMLFIYTVYKMVYNLVVYFYAFFFFWESIRT